MRKSVLGNNATMLWLHIGGHQNSTGRQSRKRSLWDRNSGTGSKGDLKAMTFHSEARLLEGRNQNPKTSQKGV